MKKRKKSEKKSGAIQRNIAISIYQPKQMNAPRNDKDHFLYPHAIVIPITHEEITMRTYNTRI